MFEGMTDKGRSCAYISFLSGLQSKFSTRNRTLRNRTKLKRPNPLNHLPKEFHFSKLLSYIRLVSQIFEILSSFYLLLIIEWTEEKSWPYLGWKDENWQAYPAEARRPKSLALSRPPYSGTQWGTRGWLPLQKRFVRSINYHQRD